MHVVVGSEQRLAGRVQISISWNIFNTILLLVHPSYGLNQNKPLKSLTG
jgi:hypothetical protein